MVPSIFLLKSFTAKWRVLKSLIARFVFEGLQPINLSQLGFQIKGLFQFQIKLQSASSVLRLDFVIGTPRDPKSEIVGD